MEDAQHAYQMTKRPWREWDFLSRLLFWSTQSITISRRCQDSKVGHQFLFWEVTGSEALLPWPFPTMALSVPLRRGCYQKLRGGLRIWILSNSRKPHLDLLHLEWMLWSLAREPREPVTELFPVWESHLSNFLVILPNKNCVLQLFERF